MILLEMLTLHAVMKILYAIIEQIKKFMFLECKGNRNGTIIDKRGGMFQI
jgi:hypothetical protein